ncbi:MAG: DUF2309 domain-containing protein [Planctomycetota bacterium]
MSDTPSKNILEQSPVVRRAGVFTPPAYDQPHVYRQLEEILSDVTTVVSKVWPLRDYVAVNPYEGITNRTFSDARSFLRIFSDCELLMPLAFYRSQYANGKFTIDEVRDSIAELTDLGQPVRLSAEDVMSALQSVPASESFVCRGDNPPESRPIRTIAEHADHVNDTNWSENITEEISKFCSAHYDEGQSSWKSPWRDLPLYQAWRSIAKLDRNIEWLGLDGFREFVGSLPPTPQAAISDLLTRLQIPTPLWESFLLCQVFSMPGWCAWTKYQDHQHESEANENLVGLLAMRLAYDVALSEVTGLSVKWDAMIDDQSATFRPQRSDNQEDIAVRTILLRAAEIGFRKSLLAKLRRTEVPKTGRQLAQMVFCIDVRSERIRRHLESVSKNVSTFGFAGFFAMPIEFVPLGREDGHAQVPALIRPSFQVRETPPEAVRESAISGRKHATLWTKLWQGFQKSAVGSFSFVETVGLLTTGRLIKRSFAKLLARKRNVESRHHECHGPSLEGLQAQGMDREAQVELAAGMLSNLGITKDFARLVVLCGHGSETVNNPLASGLDCGACGGHTGEPNAKFACVLLNHAEIREGLAAQGIEIPADTRFVAAMHNTTTDEIEIFDRTRIPESHLADLQQLTDICEVAGAKTRRERMSLLGADSPADLARRALDWSEVRPEWGLAGNAAFVVGPRHMTRDLDLNGRSFLHSYDHTADPSGAVLENIMTAPMVVAHWINMQYFASTVDNRHFGSGDKTIHNVVGGFGVLSGNSGDLMTGLPIQSLHDGKSHQHVPLRLHVVIAAPREAIAAIIERHEHVKELIENDWLHLIAVEGEQTFRYCDQDWHQLSAG